MKISPLLLLSSCAAALVACQSPPSPAPIAPSASPPPSPSPSPTPSPTPSTSTHGDARTSARAIVDASDRSEKDRGLDAGRHPVETLEFLALAPGMRVAEIGAGPGYTTELMVRAVAPTGIVFMHNEPTWLPFLKDALAERFTHPVMAKNVVRVDRAFEDPLPPDAKDLDLVVMNIIYHDIVNTKTDRAKMNANIFASLKHGGAYVVIDASAPSGSGVSATERLHRIDERVVRDEVPKAGFALASNGAFLRNADDTRDWDASPGAATKAGKRGKSDRFVLKFVRP